MLLQSEAANCMLEIETCCCKVRLSTQKSGLSFPIFHYILAMYEVKFCKISPSHGGDYKDVVLGCYAV